MKTARLIVDEPLSGPVNMARDQALLDRCSDVNTPPVLRFYTWRPPTISLGYFQDYQEYERLPPPVGGLPVVRRTTGGGAILHDLELTYALVIPPAHPLIKGRPNHLYELAHRAIIQAVGHGARLFGQSPIAKAIAPGRHGPALISNLQSARRGPFFCFARRHGLDVVVETPDAPGAVAKIAGSAQRRTARAVLQHGSIMLDSRFAQQPVATWSGLAGPINFNDAAERLKRAFEASLDIRLVSDRWHPDELDAAERIEPQYAGPAWTCDRRR